MGRPKKPQPPNKKRAARELNIWKQFGPFLSEPKLADEVKKAVLNKFREGHTKPIIINLREVKVLIPPFIKRAFFDIEYFEAHGVDRSCLRDMEFNNCHELMKYLIDKTRKEVFK